MAAESDRPWPAGGGTAGSQRLPSRYPARFGHCLLRRITNGELFRRPRRLDFFYGTPIDRPIFSHLRGWGIGDGDRITYQRRAEGWTVVLPQDDAGVRDR